MAGPSTNPPGKDASQPASQSSSSPPPKRGPSTGVWIAIAAVVIVVVLIMGLLFAGVIPGFKSSASTPSGKTYEVTFTESGLPSGTSWSVTLSGTLQSSAGTTIDFSEPNGTHSFSVGSVGVFDPTPSTGNVTVSGLPVNEQITFVNSSSKAPLGTAFAWGEPVNATSLSSSVCDSENGFTISVAFCYSIIIAGAGAGVKTSNVVLSLRNSAGATVPWPGAGFVQVTLLSPTALGDVATYDPSTGTWTEIGTFSGNFASGMTVLIGIAGGQPSGSTGGLLGISLLAVGENGFTGTVASSPFS